MARSETDPLVVTQFDEFELYDRAVVAKLVFQLENKVVPVIMGTPQRAFASVPHLYGTSTPTFGCCAAYGLHKRPSAGIWAEAYGGELPNRGSWVCEGGTATPAH
jgi:hypothetical protein